MNPKHSVIKGLHCVCPRWDTEVLKKGSAEDKLLATIYELAYKSLILMNLSIFVPSPLPTGSRFRFLGENLCQKSLGCVLEFTYVIIYIEDLTWVL